MSRTRKAAAFFAACILFVTCATARPWVFSGPDVHLQAWASVSIGLQRGPAREYQQWWQTVSGIMQQVRDVSWSLVFEDLVGLPGAATASTAQRLDDPDLQGREVEMTQLMKCINSQHNANTMSWDAAMADIPSSMKVVGSWWSNHAPKQALTVVTSASLSRLTQLYAQCLSWSGPLSAVLYQALPADSHAGLSPASKAVLRTAVTQISQFMLDMQNQPSACKPDVTLIYELYSDESARQLLYPCNVPRNLARLQARTPLVAMVDVDLVLSRSLSARANDTRAMARMVQRATKEKTVFIIPAFDVRGTHGRAAWADALVSQTSTKELLVYALEHDVVFQFAADTYKVAHAMTDYERWKTADADYPTHYISMSEPWIIGDRLTLPWHDSRYRGYGLNKQQWVAHVNATGFKFRVLHDAFTVHRAHKKNKAKEIFIDGIKSKGPDPRLFAHNAALFRRQMKKHKADKVFLPRLNRATTHCIMTLPWWQHAPLQKADGTVTTAYQLLNRKTRSKTKQ